ncbi:MAG TPA: hypothetical protein VF781_14795, partial [Solirubrobacteraceae bacterium]
RRQQARIQFAAASGGAFTTLRAVPLAGPRCYFDVQQRFPASGRVRLAWAYPHGPTVFSRVVDITLR